MNTNDPFDFRIRDDGDPADRKTWKAIAATLICAGLMLVLLVAAKSASENFTDPALLMDPPIAQVMQDQEPPQYATAPPAERLGN